MAGVSAPEAAESAARASWLRRHGSVVFGAVALAALAAELWFAAPYIGDAADAVTDARPGWLVLALVAEAFSMMAFARLQRVILRGAGIKVRLPDAVSTVYAGNAMTVTLPGGSLASFAYSLRRMRSWGASTPLAVFSLAATGALSTIALVSLSGAGFVMSGNIGGMTGGIVETVLLVVAAVAILKLIGHRRATTRVVRFGVRLWTRVRPGTVTLSDRAIVRAVADLSAQRPSTLTWLRGMTFALLKWTGDIVCLFATLEALGHQPGLSSLLLAYAAGMAAASTLPLLPGGIGFVEPAIILVLVHGGLPLAAATAGVLIYRCINLGMVACAGWLVLLARRAPSLLHRSRVVAAAADVVAPAEVAPAPTGAV